MKLNDGGLSYPKLRKGYNTISEFVGIINDGRQGVGYYDFLDGIWYVQLYGLPLISVVNVLFWYELPAVKTSKNNK